MKILIAHEKHGIRLFRPDRPDINSDWFSKAYYLLLKERIEEEYFEGKALEEAKSICNDYFCGEGNIESLDKRGKAFFRKRMAYEYERIEILETEN